MRGDAGHGGYAGTGHTKHEIRKKGRYNMDTKTLTGKLTVLPAGHKIGPEKLPTWYRDEQGNFHAEFYKATMGEQGADGKFHSYTWNISADEAETLANYPLGTLFKAVLRAKTRTETTVDDKGNPVQTVVARVTPSTDKTKMFHDVVCEEIDVAKKGNIPRGKTIQYFADVKAPTEDDAGADNDEG